MLQIRVILQDSNTGRNSRIIAGLETLAASAQFPRVRSAVAYATLHGCQDLIGKYSRSMRNWSRIHKQWLISIDFGRTEATALEFLAALPNSEVRIPDAEDLLRHRLIPARCFHPKTVIFDCGTDELRLPVALFIGSANLTRSGILTGVEHATSMVWLEPLTRSESRQFNELREELRWWEEAWQSASILTPSLVTRYNAVRPVLPREDSSRSVNRFASPNPRVVEIQPGAAWSCARCFWVQTRQLYRNLNFGNIGNQVDLRRGTRVYFGCAPDVVPPNTVMGHVDLQYDQFPPRNCSVRFGDNQMDKINLPVPGEDGPATYDNSVIHFERTGPSRFRIRLGTNAEITQWTQRSELQGLRYTLAGGRAFGFYS